MGRLFNVWFSQEIEANRKSENDHKSIKKRYLIYVAPLLPGVPLSMVRRGLVMKAIDKARLEKKMRTANLVLANLGQMFRFAVAREWMQGDPTAAIARKQAGGQENEGERVLSDDELPILRDVLAKPPQQKSRYYVARRRVLPVHTESMVWWTLATAARPIEVATMHRKGPLI